MKPRGFLFATCIGCLLLALCASAASGQTWVAHYSALPDFNSPRGLMIAVDGSGNVLSVGYVRSDSTREDYLVIKYDSRGNQLWVRHYDYIGKRDVPRAVAVDREGNVFVTGESKQDRSSNARHDYATIKYRPDGDVAWIARFGPDEYNDEPWAMAIDDGGNVYVTGEARYEYTQSDFATVKYDSTGTVVWVARTLDGARARGIVLDELGNVYVTGDGADSTAQSGSLTVKYDSAGQELWASCHADVNSFVVKVYGRDRDVYIGGSYHGGWPDYWVAKLDSSGRPVWEATYDCGDDIPYDMTQDDSGNVYVTGRSSGSGTQYDVCTVSWDSSGNLRWVVRYDGPTSSSDGTRAVHVDGKRVYVCGYRRGETESDICTFTYDRDGVLKWQQFYDGPVSRGDGGTDLTVDSAGYVYVVGASVFDTAGHRECVTIKYPPGGVAIAEPKPPVAHKPAPATIVRAVLHMPESAIRHSSFALLNSAGRKVMDLHPGDNDVRHLSPGVYFVRPAGTVPASGIPGDSPFRAKVILTR